MFETKFSDFKVNAGTINFYKDISIPFDFYPNLPYIFRATLYRKKMNMNSFILTVGNPRTSKSFTMMKYAEIMEEMAGRKFDVEKQLTLDDVKKFINWSRNATESIFILDETGTTLSPDLFWSLQQRVMRRFVQTQGFRKNILVWVLPSVVYIQKGFRFMSNYAVQTVRQGQVDVYKIVVNQLIGKGYPEYIESTAFSLPLAETVEKYLVMKEEWNNAELEKDLQFLNELDKEYEKPLPMNIIFDLHKKNIIDKNTAIEELNKLGFNPIRAELVLQSRKIIPEETQTQYNTTDTGSMQTLLPA